MASTLSNGSFIRTRWAAIGAAIAVSLGAGGIGLVNATASSGERAVFRSIPSCRVIDVRPASQVGPKASPLGPTETLTVSAHGDNGDCTGIPSDAVALSLNVTALNASQTTFLTIFAADVSRPNASSLNPSPGAPPTPNAVTVDLSPTGQFNIFNNLGNVNVIVDINGYYIDHDHDDRYDTSGEVDAKIADAQTVGPTRITRGMIDMYPFNEGSGWTRALGFRHDESVSSECIVTSIDPLPGQTVTRVAATYLSTAPAVLGVTINGFVTQPGAVTGAGDLLHQIGTRNDTAPTSGGFQLSEFETTIGSDPVIRQDVRYEVDICTAEAITITGVTVDLTNS